MGDEATDTSPPRRVLSLAAVLRTLPDAAPAPFRQFAGALRRLHKRRNPRRGSFGELIDERRTWLFDTLPMASAE